MRNFPILLVATLCLTACDDEPTAVFFAEPSDARLEGVWTGNEDIQTMQDNNVFTFPIVLSLDANNRFTLITSNYPTSFDNVNERTCAGAYTRVNNTLRFFPATACRALPLTEFTLGRVLPGGVTLEARTYTSFASVRVLMRLDRD